MVRVSSPPQSRSKAVVCVSTPRMYPRSGYFLVNEYYEHQEREVLLITRKYPLCGYFLGVLMHTTAWDRLWRGEQTQVLVWNSLGIATHSSNLTCLLKLWPCGFKIEYMHLGFASAAAVPLGSEGDPGCIFFTLNTYQTTFISDSLWYACRNWS